MPPFAPFPLTPSELVFLNGDKYAKKQHLINNTKLMHIDLSVSTSELVYAMLTTAFLACEAEGVLRLVMGRQKQLLRTRDVLFAEPGTRGAIWPQPSIESKLLEHRSQLARRSAHTVSGIVYHLLDSDCASPGSSIIELCKPYMAQRNLVIGEDKKALGVFRYASYTLPIATIQGAAQFPMTRINQMLIKVRETRPQLMKMLIDGIKSGIAQRVEQTDDD